MSNVLAATVSTPTYSPSIWIALLIGIVVGLLLGMKFKR